MSEIRSIGDDCAQDVAEHSLIDLAILELGGPVGPRRVEDVGDVRQFGELSVGVVCVQNVALDILDGMICMPTGSRPSTHTVNLPWTPRRVRQR